MTDFFLGFFNFPNERDFLTPMSPNNSGFTVFRNCNESCFDKSFIGATELMGMSRSWEISLEMLRFCFIALRDFRDLVELTSRRGDVELGLCLYLLRGEEGGGRSHLSGVL